MSSLSSSSMSTSSLLVPERVRECLCKKNHIRRKTVGCIVHPSRFFVAGQEGRVWGCFLEIFCSDQKRLEWIRSSCHRQFFGFSTNMVRESISIYIFSTNRSYIIKTPVKFCQFMSCFKSTDIVHYVTRNIFLYCNLETNGRGHGRGIHIRQLVHLLPF